MSSRKRSFAEQPARPEDAQAQAQAQEDAHEDAQAQEEAHDEAQEECELLREPELPDPPRGGVLRGRLTGTFITFTRM